MIDKIKKFFYGLFNGMDAAEKEMLSTSNDPNTTISIERQQETNSMADAMLKGEVTEEVKEMRYRDYKVSRNSEHFSYIGNGLAVKKDDNLKPHYRGSALGGTSDILLVQDNSLIYNNVYEELERLDSYGSERRYLIKCERKCFTRFRIEEFIHKIIVKKGNEENKVFLQLYVSEYPREDNLILTKGFINQIKAIYEGKIPPNSDIFDIESIWFITQNAYNSDDLFKFEYKNVIFDRIEEYDGNYVIIFNATVSINGEDLTKKYYNKTVEERYKNREKRTNTFVLDASLNDEYTCSICGKKINKYDAQITDVTFGRPMCIDCLAIEESKKLKITN